MMLNGLILKMSDFLCQNSHKALTDITRPAKPRTSLSCDLSFKKFTFFGSVLSKCRILFKIRLQQQRPSPNILFTSHT